MNSKHHKSDALQVAIQLLVVTTKEIYMWTQSPQISQKQDGHNIYLITENNVLSLPVITKMALWQLRHLGTWYKLSFFIVYEKPLAKFYYICICIINVHKYICIDR